MCFSASGVYLAWVVSLIGRGFRIFVELYRTSSIKDTLSWRVVSDWSRSCMNGVVSLAVVR